MIEGGITLGHLIMAMAAVELIAVPLLARSVRRSNPEGSEDQRRAVAIVVAASVVAAIALFLFGLLGPVARMRIL
jgi:chorismate synthase